MTTNLFDITTPAFGGKPVRTVTGNGETWFCSKDVFTALDISAPNVRQKLDVYGVKDDEVRNFQLVGLKNGPGRPPLYINATAVRRIAQRSTKPAAREFQTFMNKTVAGAIEKDGAYVHPAVAQEAPDILKMVEQATYWPLWTSPFAAPASSLRAQEWRTPKFGISATTLRKSVPVARRSTSTILRAPR